MPSTELCESVPSGGVNRTHSNPGFLFRIQTSGRRSSRKSSSLSFSATTSPYESHEDAYGTALAVRRAFVAVYYHQSLRQYQRQYPRVHARRSEIKITRSHRCTTSPSSSVRAYLVPPRHSSSQYSIATTVSLAHQLRSEYQLIFWYVPAYQTAYFSYGQTVKNSGTSLVQNCLPIHLVRAWYMYKTFRACLRETTTTYVLERRPKSEDDAKDAKLGRIA